MQEEEVTVEAIPACDNLTPAVQSLNDRDWKQTEQTWRRLVEDCGFVLIRLKPTSKDPFGWSWGNKVRHKPFEKIGLQPSMNAAVVCGKESRLIVLDIDKPEEFEKLGLEVPVTFTVETKKGTHHYYKLPADGHWYRNRRKDTYDIKAERGYVAAPGSVHPDGPVYTLVNDVEPVEAPEWLLQESRESEKVKERKQRRHEHACTEGDIDSLKLSPTILEYIRQGPPEGSDRSAIDFAVIAALLKAGCSDAQIEWVFTEYPISEKSEEHPNKNGYLQRTIDAACERLEEELCAPEWSHISIPSANDLDTEYKLLADTATKNLVRTLEDHGNEVSEGREQALGMLINTYAAMASGKLKGRVAFPLPTGHGKTTSLISFLECASQLELMGDRSGGGFTIAITAFKVEELCEINRSLLEAGVPESAISLLHSYKHREGLSFNEHGLVGKNCASMPATKKIDARGEEVFDYLQAHSAAHSE